MGSNQLHEPRRDVHGVLLLDKPQGLSSNAALQAAKRLFCARKAGHTGSLDPLATGLLPICFGAATRVSAFLLDADKHYQVTVRLGNSTTTADAEGEVLETVPVPALTPERVEAALAAFRGPIQQVPPMYSALKHQGRRLYELARAGQEVDRPARPVTIHSLTLLALDTENLALDVHCSKGTYIRSLAEDLAQALGTVGHVQSLRRLGAGPYSATGMLTLDELQARAEAGEAALDACLLPVDSAVADWPIVSLSAELAWYLQRGQPVQAPGAPDSPTGGWVRIYAADGVFLGLGEIDSAGRVAPRRLLLAD